ncbi:MAG: amidohydrolase family protein [Actinobacteria bacterium]|nr:amidohydrolase family protein [Actinomycetota bacterium]
MKVNTDIKNKSNNNNYNLNNLLAKDFKIIDMHVHMGKYSGLFVNTSYENLAVEAVLELNFKKIIVTHHSFFVDPVIGINETIKIIKKNKDFIYGYVVYNPNHIEKSLKIIEEFFNKNNTNAVDRNIVGIKMHPEDHQCFIDDPGYESLWKIASEKDIPILSHTWNPNVANKNQKFADALLFEKVASAYPGLKIILGHAGAKDYYYYEVIKMIKRCINKNIFVDLAGDIFYSGMIELFVKEIGSERVLFGTDIPWCDPLYQVINVINSGISDKDRENIFFSNAAGIFKL